MTLSVNNVGKIIEGNPILENVNFDMEAGSIVGLVGCNGVGKTTLMRLIAGEMQPESGQIQFDETGRASVFYLDTLSNWMTSYTAILAADVLAIFYLSHLLSFLFCLFLLSFSDSHSFLLFLF